MLLSEVVAFLTKEKRMSNKIKLGIVGLSGGVMLGFGGCLNTESLLASAATYAVFEFAFDNDSTFDLFQDDFGTGTEFDDRFVTDPSRNEVEVE